MQITEAHLEFCMKTGQDQEKCIVRAKSTQVVNHSKQQICYGASVQTSLNSPMMSGKEISDIFYSLDK